MVVVQIDPKDVLVRKFRPLTGFESLTSIAGITKYMRECKSLQEWHSRRLAVQRANGNRFRYMWLGAVVATGLTVSVRNKLPAI